MAKISDAIIGIQEALAAGMSVEQVAKAEGVPISWVEHEAKRMFGPEGFDDDWDNWHEGDLM